MPDQWDLDLGRHANPNEPAAPRPPMRPPTWSSFAGVLLILAAGVAAYIVFGRAAPDPAEQPATSGPAVQATDVPVGPLGGDADAIAVPPLDASDALVRELVGKLSSHPRLSAWLATEGLIRNFTAVVVNISEGQTPAMHLSALRPAAPFRVVVRDGDLHVDPRSYQRYDQLADALASLDTVGTVRLYATLKPRLEEAHRDLGFPDASFDRAFERAMVHLLSAPVADEPVSVEPRGIVYGFADPRFEDLTDAQKHLLRMGPRNVRLIQQQLRAIALELGIPAARLPALR